MSHGNNRFAFIPQFCKKLPIESLNTLRIVFGRRIISLPQIRNGKAECSYIIYIYICLRTSGTGLINRYNEMCQVYVAVRIPLHHPSNGDVHLLQQRVRRFQAGCRIMIAGNDNNLQCRTLGCHPAEKRVIQPLRFCGRVRPVKYISGNEEYINLTFFDLPA